MTATASLTFFCPTTVPQGGMALYHNLGNGKFEDVTKKAGLDSSLHAIGCTAGDYDNDGATDLAVSLNGRVLLLHNEKNGTFKDVTDAAGIKSAGLNLGLAFIDYDHDGDLDLYVTRNTSMLVSMTPVCGTRSPPVCFRKEQAACGATTVTEPLPTSPIRLASRDLHSA